MQAQGVKEGWPYRSAWGPVILPVFETGRLAWRYLESAGWTSLKQAARMKPIAWACISGQPVPQALLGGLSPDHRSMSVIARLAIKNHVAREPSGLPAWNSLRDEPQQRGDGHSGCGHRDGQIVVVGVPQTIFLIHSFVPQIAAPRS